MKPHAKLLRGPDAKACLILCILSGASSSVFLLYTDKRLLSVFELQLGTFRSPILVQKVAFSMRVVAYGMSLSRSCSAFGGLL